jgi:hypothetical protein
VIEQKRRKKARELDDDLPWIAAQYRNHASSQDSEESV